MKMKIRQSIEKSIKRTEGKRKNWMCATIRQDVVRRAIERGEFEKLECAYHYTDDYAWDNANNFGKGEVSAKHMLEKYEILKPTCWVDREKKIVNGKECYVISILFHSNLSYDMYVPVE
jgi:hypothetical protein